MGGVTIGQSGENKEPEEQILTEKSCYGTGGDRKIKWALPSSYMVPRLRIRLGAKSWNPMEANTGYVFTQRPCRESLFCQSYSGPQKQHRSSTTNILRKLPHAHKRVLGSGTFGAWRQAW